MKKKILEDDIIDLQDILEILWKEKILIILFCVIGLIFSKAYYEIKHPETYEEYETNVVIQEAPKEIFLKYSDVVNIGIYEEFNKQFKLLLTSNDMKAKFLEQSDFKDFKNFLKEFNISAKQYFESKTFGEIDENSKNYTVDNNYYFRYPKSVNGQKFVNELILHVRDETVAYTKNKVRTLLNKLIKEYEQDLKIAEEIELEHPMLKQNSLTGNSQVVQEPTDLFYKGTIVLQNRIYDMISLREELNQNQLFFFNPILDSASTSKGVQQKNYLIYYYLLGLTLAFILSLITIMIKNIKKKIK